MRYRLERRDGVPTGSAWWNVGGTAFHETIREWETLAAGDAAPSADATALRFPHHLAEATAAEVIRSGTGPHEWRTGGRVSEKYPNKEDRAWWLDKGPEMAAQYVLAQEGREYEILRLDAGSIGADGVAPLALELGFLYDPGDNLPPLKGFIDQVLYFPVSDSILIRDLKSGSNMPVDPFQLQVYRLALEQCFGIEAAHWWGDYWNARKGVATKGYNLADRFKLEQAVRYRLSTMDTAESLGLYAPNPGNNCSACGVKAHCPAMSDQPFATWGRALDPPTASE